MEPCKNSNARPLWMGNGPGQAPKMDAGDQIHKYSRLIFMGDVKSIWPKLSAELKKIFGGNEQGLIEFVQSFHDLVGKSIQVTSETVRQENGITRLDLEGNGEKNTFTMEMKVDSKGIIVKLRIRRKLPDQAAPSRFLDYQTQTPLRLLFQGRWYVWSGGRTLHDNHHIRFQNQRFAYDFLVKEDGKTHRGEGTQNEDYYCFGRPVFAPGQGRVTAIEETLPDNPPGQRDYENILGNHIVIDHGNGEFSFLVHLRRGSIQVEPGEIVVQGALLAQCGNSGNSNQPHLHYHLQNSADHETGEGLPALFQGYEADGKFVKLGEPRHGQFVEQK